MEPALYITVSNSYSVPLNEDFCVPIMVNPVIKNIKGGRPLCRLKEQVITGFIHPILQM